MYTGQEERRPRRRKHRGGRGSGVAPGQTSAGTGPPRRSSPRTGAAQHDSANPPCACALGAGGPGAGTCGSEPANQRGRRPAGGGAHSRLLTHMRLVLLGRALPAEVAQEELPGLLPQAGAQALRAGGAGGAQRGPLGRPRPAPPRPPQAQRLTPEKMRARNSGTCCRRPSGPMWRAQSSSVTGGARSTAGRGPSSTCGAPQ